MLPFRVARGWWVGEKNGKHRVKKVIECVGGHFADF